MNPVLLSATLKPYIDDEKASRQAFAVHGSSWDGDGEHQVGARRVRVRWCRSMLEMREHLSEWDRSLPLAMVTPVTNQNLADDLRARLFRKRILDADIGEILQLQFGARSVDARLRRDPELGRLLLDVVGDRSVPAPMSGVLFEEAVWEILIRARFEPLHSKADLVDLLDWMRRPDRFSGTPESLRTRLEDWFVRRIGPEAKAVFECYRRCPESPVAVGLAFEPMLKDSRPDLLRALGRMDRFTGDQPIPHEAAEKWSKAASEVVARCDASEVSALTDALDRVLTSVGAGEHADLSRWSRLGRRKVLDELGYNGPSAELLERVRDRQWPDLEKPILARIDMLVRLVRWLSTEEPTWRDLPAAVEWYLADGSWVDWARSRLRITAESNQLSNLFLNILRRVSLRREQLNRRFAEVLASWTVEGSAANTVAGVEHILERYVAPVAAQPRPVLLIVMDGMSLAVARELQSELEARRWTSWSTRDRELSPAVAVLPSVTQFSRASLLAGKITTGSQTTEARDFASRSDFRSAVLFHKSDLLPASEEVIREIADTENRRVVGLVINAIDDELSGSRQVSPDWTLEYLSVLRGILSEAATAGRTVILTADHGHTLDNGTQMVRSASASADRWRAGERAEDESEVKVRGPRVPVGPEGFIGLAVEGGRYMPRPRNGYHGGLTPQECLVPVMVLTPPGIEVRGWQMVAPVPPAWWTEPAAVEVHAPAVEPQASKLKPRQPDLFAPPVDWIDELVGSEVFRAQLERAGNRVTGEHVASVVRILDAAGGRLMKAAFAQRLAMPAMRVSGAVAAAQRVLNVDMYPILELNENSQTISLNVPLLKKQFGLR